MEKTMAMVMMAMLLCGQMVRWAPNGLDALLMAAGQGDVVVDGVVLESWTAQAGPRALGDLSKALDVAELGESGEAAIGTDGSLKWRKQGQTLTVQMILPDTAEARAYYGILSRWMRRYGQGQPVGATVMTHTADMMDMAQGQALVEQMVNILPARLVSTMQEDNLASSAYQVAGVEPGLCIAGERVNVNVACVVKNGQCAIYLGSPVIYQQY